MKDDTDKKPLVYIGEEDGDFCIFEYAEDGDGKHIANIGCQLQAVSEMPENLIAFDVDKKYAKLFTEAGNVELETGLTPRQLLEQRDGLLEAVNALLGLVTGNMEGKCPVDDDPIELAREAKAKAESGNV